MYSVELSLFFLSTALYSVILFCVFFWIPFVYFYYEEKDDDDTSKCTVSMFILGGGGKMISFLQE